jgi:hypothetical protein
VTRGVSEDERYGTTVSDGRVYVRTPDGAIEIGRVEAVLDLVGGPAWTIEYGDWHRERYPDLDTADEGLTVDVVDVLAAMEHDRGFVESLRALPAEPQGDDEVSPRLGLFVGRLLGNLQTGVD